MFLAIELLSLASYCLIALPGTKRTLEAVIKYLAIGTISTCLLLFGVLLAYSLTTKIDLLAFVAPYGDCAATWCVPVFIVPAFLIKLGAAPFHYWVADVYDNAPATTTVLLSTFVKLCVFLLFCRVLYVTFGESVFVWQPLVATSAAASIAVGCLGALYQKRVKRLLAYSSINNVGYALAALSTASPAGLQAGVAYLLFYVFTLALLFILLNSPAGEGITYISDMKKLRAYRPYDLIATAVLFSLAGIPPLSGFWVKFFVLSELINTEFYVLAVVGALFSVVSSFYYVNLIKILYFEKSVIHADAVTLIDGRISIVFVLSVVLVVYPLFPQAVYGPSRIIAAVLGCGFV